MTIRIVISDNIIRYSYNDTAYNIILRFTVTQFNIEVIISCLPLTGTNLMTGRDPEACRQNPDERRAYLSLVLLIALLLRVFV